MITPAQIRQKALRKYGEFLTSHLQERDFFPLPIVGNKGRSNMPVEALYAGMKELMDASKTKKGFGFEVELREVNTRRAGRRSMPQRIYFPTQEDYLAFLGKNTEFARFIRQVAYTGRSVPLLLPFVERQPLKLIAHLAIWPDLLKVVDFFLHHPFPDQYPRELPIEVHTKFVEQHKGILNDLLLAVLPPNALSPQEKNFEKRFGLRYDEPVVRIRTLDQNAIDDIPAFMTDLSLPVSQLQQLQVRSNVVFVVENKLTFLSFPSHTKGLVIWGKGFAVELLKNVQWLKQVPIFFWGDLDAQGFQMLHQLRGYFPQTRSLLMDLDVYHAFAPFAVNNKSAPTAMDLSRLTDAERACYAFLCQTDKNRLEQEHISQSYLISRLQKDCKF